MYYDKNQGRPMLNHHEHLETRTPKIDLFETDISYYLRLSIPGVQKENLSIFFNQQGFLEISGNVSTVVPDNIIDIITQEIFEGPFHRTVRIPKSVDKQNIHFDYLSGILEIHIMKFDT